MLVMHDVAVRSCSMGMTWQTMTPSHRTITDYSETYPSIINNKHHNSLGYPILDREVPDGEPGILLSEARRIDPSAWRQISN